MHILAIDVGTSSVKAALLNTTHSGRTDFPIARASYTLDTPTPDAAEVPADRLWQAVTQACRAALKGSKIEPEGIGLSCMMPALVLLDKNAQPLGPIWTHLDRRARPASRQVLAAVGDEFLATVGNRPLPGGISALCFRQRLHEDPYLAHHVGSYLHANGYLAFRMTGVQAFEPGNASFSGLFNTVTNRQWSRRWCDYFEVDPRWLPPVVCGSSVLGSLLPQVATELGAPAGIPVKLGVADTSSAMIDVRMQPGDLLHEVGTTQVLAVVTDQPKPSPKRLTRLLGAGDHYTHVTHNPVGGVALDWIRHLCFRDLSDQAFFDQAIPEALQRTTRVTLDPPFLGGDRLEIEAHRAALRDLELTTDRLDLLKALLDAMLRRHREAVANLGQGTEFRRIILTGGGAEVIHKLIPEYQSAKLEILVEGSLHGVARLWD